MIHSCPLCQYFSTFYSARTIYLHWKPSRDCLVQPCHSGLHLQSRKVCFSWDQLCVSLVFPRSILSACWMGVHAQCWVSCAFFLSGVWVSCNWHSVCRPPVVHRPWVEEHCSTTLTEASPKHKDFHQFCTRKLFSPQPVFSLHFPHLHIPLVLSLLLNFIQNNPSLGTNTLVWALFHLSLVG